MDEHTSGEGGSANTPPFPPRRTPAPEPSHEQSSTQADSPQRMDRADSEPAIAGQPDPARARALPDSEDPDDAPLPRPFPPPRERRIRRPNRAFQEMAERLEEAADRLDHLVEAQLAPALGDGRATGAGQAVSSSIHDLADYLRESDLRSIRDDLADQVRVKPLQTLLVAVGAGWLLGKIVR
jgi:hypothetical protein